MKQTDMTIMCAISSSSSYSTSLLLCYKSLCVAGMPLGSLLNSATTIINLMSIFQSIWNIFIKKLNACEQTMLVCVGIRGTQPNVTF